MKILLILVCMLMTGSARAEPLPEAARPSDWKFSSSVNYDTGKYGTPDRTESLYISFTLKRRYGDADLSVTVPYVRQSSRGQVTWVGGRPMGMGKKNPALTAVAATTSESGLGDIMVRGTYLLAREGQGSFDLVLAAKLKLPAADKDKGLGTGELDGGLGLEFSKGMGASWTLLADSYFTAVGEPEGMDFNNQVSLDIGFYKTLRENLGLTVLYAAQSAIVDGNPGPRSLSGALSYNSPAGINYSCGLALGLSDGSPDIGLSAGFSRKF